ncbi:hypothetical protein PHYSODRAFT_476727 [Phytophthora sojae]|uniref:Uncharacterized protein n=1 Tax=Phytophthora sojae (strain P6497) TaxID=1094619 RepID=G4YFR1_PHYSP|nr:hypothetical protein PHYSODRAFT_476727 [Phytophthora sojae]EGZ27638.1 hypothetical protein PHYSODRAFT_476727 [Phytophthora sojae]|eukprot:XP_009514913.1 hypothetical protein PHYSODRAFT_476727 [Phytophthora sojae]
MLERQLQADETKRDVRIAHVLRREGIAVPSAAPKTSDHTGKVPRYCLHYKKQHGFSRLISRSQFTLEQVVELEKGQSPEDPRPNKALSPNRLHRLLEGFEHRDSLCSAARFGIDPQWSTQNQEQQEQQRIPTNHKSADRHLNTVVKSVREGQDGGQYLVLDANVLETLGNIRISPLDAVPKANTDPQLETRLIHDLSYPIGNSTNDASDKSSFPEVRYRHVAAVARRIEECYAQNPMITIYVMKGDVKGAFRHIS